jgi:hypothetical protein
MVERQLPKLHTWVRFPSPAPYFIFMYSILRFLQPVFLPVLSLFRVFLALPIWLVKCPEMALTVIAAAGLSLEASRRRRAHCQRLSGQYAGFIVTNGSHAPVMAVLIDECRSQCRCGGF